MTQGPILAVDVSGAYGGAQRSFSALLAGLHGRGRPIVCAAASRTLRDGLHAVGIPTEQIPPVNWQQSLAGCVRAIWDLYTYRRWLTSTCKRLQPSLIYANGLQSELLMTGYAESPPLVFHHRDCRSVDWLLRRAVEPAACVFVLSDFMADRVRRQLPTHLHSKLVRVYNGIDHSVLAAVEAKAVPSATPLLVLAADFVDWKRHGLFLQALAVLRGRFPKLQAVLVGGARDRAGQGLLQRLQTETAALGLQDCVVFAGSVPSALPWIKAADVLCSTSLHEPFGRSVLEAAALGTPVVATGPGGPAEILAGLDACTCAPAEPHAIAAACESVIGKRVKPSKAWRLKFSIEQHVKLIEERLAGVLTV